MNVVFLLSSNVVPVNDVGGVTVTVTVAVDPRYDLGVYPSAVSYTHLTLPTILLV